MLQAGGHACNIGKRTARVALHHPQVGTALGHDHQRIINHPAIDAAHAEDDHQEQPDAAGQVVSGVSQVVRSQVVAAHSEG